MDRNGLTNVITSLILAIAFVSLWFLGVGLLDLGEVNGSLAFGILFLIYLIITVSLMKNQRIITRNMVVEKPYIQEIVREVEKPVEVIREVEKPIYVVESRKKLEIPKYEYVGSTQTKTYHTRNCRLGKLIKRKYKLSENNKSFFVKQGFKACKSCLKNK